MRASNPARADSGVVGLGARRRGDLDGAAGGAAADRIAALGLCCDFLPISITSSVELLPAVLRHDFINAAFIYFIHISRLDVAGIL